MKMTNLLMPMTAALLLLCGCDYNDKNFEGLDDLTQIKDVKNIDYTLTDADYALLTGNPKKNLYFSEEDPADNFLPAWLAKTYLGASPTSVVRVTFNYLDAPSTLLKPFSAIPYLGLEKNADYTPIYGEGIYAPYLNSTSENDIIRKLLKAKYPTPVKGDYVMVGYNYNATAVPQQIETPVVNYDFDALPVGNVTKIDGWFLSAPDAKPWQVASYGSSYLQYSAYGTKEECVAWLVTPEIEIEGDDKNFAFDITVGRYSAPCLSVLISENFDGKDVSKATWKDVTSSFTLPIPDPVDKYTSKVSAGKLLLTEYAGKKIRIAFNYVGDGANNKTTTYQIDNVVVGKDIPTAVTVTSRFKFYQCLKDNVWTLFENKEGNTAYCPTYDDYLKMGAPGKNVNFSSTVKPEDYMPSYLNSQVAYPLNKDARVMIYRYSSKALEAQAREYIYSTEAGRWELNTQIAERTRQYAFDGTKWIFDPSLTIILSTSKNDKGTSAFYQSITDWVKVNKGANFVTSFGNNDYYYGGSAYGNNFDFRLSSWRTQDAASYGKLTDGELKSLMMSRLPEAFIPGLESQYPKAEPSEGVNVIYKINFSIYDGTNTTEWTISYKVVGKAKFEYIEDSLQAKA